MVLISSIKKGKRYVLFVVEFVAFIFCGERLFSRYYFDI